MKNIRQYIIFSIPLIVSFFLILILIFTKRVFDDFNNWWWNISTIEKYAEDFVYDRTVDYWGFQILIAIRNLWLLLVFMYSPLLPILINKFYDIKKVYILSITFVNFVSIILFSAFYRWIYKIIVVDLSSARNIDLLIFDITNAAILIVSTLLILIFAFREYNKNKKLKEI